MTNPMFNPPPNYSGVTIQIANPAVYAGAQNPCCRNIPQEAFIYSGQCGYNTNPLLTNPQTNNLQAVNQENTPANKTENLLPQAYPAQYYTNNYNYQNNGYDVRNATNNGELTQNLESKENQGFMNIPDSEKSTNPFMNGFSEQNGISSPNGMNSYRDFASSPNAGQEQDFTKSNGIITDLDERQAEIEEAKKNKTETKIVALTDEYIKSLENYLNNPNDEIRLMASKEILTRLDEDKDRCDDAALNALLNKMMQDPSKLVRIAALSAFASGLATGNDYTVQLLHNIQSNPNSDKEDVLQAADILLRMTSGTEIKSIPNPMVKENQETKQ